MSPYFPPISRSQERGMLMKWRFTMTIIEMGSEAVLLGIFFALLVVPTREMSWLVLCVSALPVIFVLFFHGYYVTRPILGTLWKNPRPAAYGASAAVLYVIHMYIAIALSKSDLTPEAASKALPLLLGGAAIVFVCALIGRLQLRNWRRRSRGPGAQDG